uniref:Uncharacterized protein n=1 Tax=Anguilla anguilla TaxID=7936 RepID=A0A0E9W820_ANGAN
MKHIHIIPVRVHMRRLSFSGSWLIFSFHFEIKFKMHEGN